MRKRTRLMILSAALILATLMHVSRTGAVTNSTFESDTGGWVASRSFTDNCDVPVRVPSEHTRWEGGSYLVALGDTRTGLGPGCSPSYVFRDFDCKTGNDVCTASFDAALWLVAGERAAVVLQSGQSTVAFEIPGTRLGRSKRYSVSAPASSRPRLAFVVWSVANAADGTRSVLHIDNISVTPASENETSAELTPLHLAGIPVVVDEVDGAELQTADTEAGADCDGDSVPDQYGISQGIASDENGDGIPDGCAGNQRGINWVLMFMGIFILTVTLMRLIRKNRSRYAL